MELKTGSAESTLDDKGRVSIPIRFREQFQGDLVISWGMEHCIWIMKPATWETFEKRMRNSTGFNQEEWRYFEYTVLGQIQTAELDKTGRIAIPPTFRRYASLSRDCMVISAEDRLSIWDTEVFYAYLAEKSAMAQTAMNKLGTHDIFKAE